MKCIWKHQISDIGTIYVFKKQHEISIGIKYLDQLYDLYRISPDGREESYDFFSKVTVQPTFKSALEQAKNIALACHIEST